MGNENNHIYQELLDRIIEVQKDLFGGLAIRAASKVKEFEISLDGKVVKISGSIEDAVRHLIYEYEALGGELSKFLSEAVLKAYRKDYPNINLPEC